MQVSTIVDKTIESPAIKVSSLCFNSLWPYYQGTIGQPAPDA